MNSPLTEETVEECADDEHDWDYISTWGGDPNVINGTFAITSKTCKRCGKEDEWNGRHDSSMEYEHEKELDQDFGLDGWGD